MSEGKETCNDQKEKGKGKEKEKGTETETGTKIVDGQKSKTEMTDLNEKTAEIGMEGKVEGEAKAEAEAEIEIGEIEDRLHNLPAGKIDRFGIGVVKDHQDGLTLKAVHVIIPGIEIKAQIETEAEARTKTRIETMADCCDGETFRWPSGST